MSIDRLLDASLKKDFVEQYFFTQPFSLRGGCESLAALGSWESIDQILKQEEVDLLVARRGELHGELHAGATPRSGAEAQALHDEGYTLVIRHAERHHPELVELAAGFAKDFLAPVNIHLYCTPPQQHGFGWHYDAEDVFILQTTGDKEYSLRKNTVNPWPTIDTLPADMQYEREIMPLMQCRLSGGDWLYIPAGYWHMAQAHASSISLAVGVLSRTAVDVLDELRRRALDNLRWRQRLPISGTAATSPPEEVAEAMREMFQQLAEDLRRQLTSEQFVRQFLEGKEGRREI